MRVLYASWGYSVHDRRFISAYTDAGHTVAHAPLDCARITEDRRLPNGAHAIALPPLTQGAPLADAIGPFGEALAQFEPDVIHAGPVPSVAWVAEQARAAAAADTPLIAMSWGSDMLREVVRKPEAFERAAYVLARAQALQCDCMAVERVATQSFAFDAERVIRFPWGIDTDHFSPGPPDPALRAMLGEPDDVIVLSNRTWEPIYGVDTAIEAFAMARAANPRLRLALAGSGSLAPMVEATITENGLGDSVTLLGRVPNAELVGLLRACDIYLSCSHSDGTSISLLEAMGCGLPAVVSEIPGNLEWIRPADGGLIAPVGNAREFSEALASLASNESARSEHGVRNRRVVEERAEWSRNVTALIAAAERLADGLPPR